MNGSTILVGLADGRVMQGGVDTIAIVKMHGDESAFNQGEQTANARLIAAAPKPKSPPRLPHKSHSAAVAMSAPHS